MTRCQFSGEKSKGRRTAIVVHHGAAEFEEDFNCNSDKYVNVLNWWSGIQKVLLAKWILKSLLLYNIIQQHRFLTRIERCSDLQFIQNDGKRAKEEN